MLDKNMYSYCDNNPINRVDENGKFWNVIIGAAVGAVFGFAGKVVSNIITGQKPLDGAWAATVGGAVAGTIIGGTGNVVAGLFTGSLVENSMNEIATYTNKENKKKVTTSNVGNSLRGVGTNSLLDGGIGRITYGVASKIIKINPKWIEAEKVSTILFGKTAQKEYLRDLIQTSFLFFYEGGKSLR